MKRHTLILFCLLLITPFAFCQSVKTIKKLLSKNYPPTKFIGSRWVYYKRKADVKFVDDTLVRPTDPRYTLYTINLTNTLHYSWGSKACIGIFDRQTDSLTIVPPLWYGGFSTDLLKVFVGKKFQDENAISLFTKKLQTLLVTGSTGEFENIGYDVGLVKFDYTQVYNDKKEVWRKVEIRLVNNMIQSFLITNPIGHDSIVVGSKPNGVQGL